jgi:hypothetical protein
MPASGWPPDAGEESGMNPITHGGRTALEVPPGCAMVGCGQPAAPVPLVVNVAAMPGPFEIPLCALCREPFEAGLEGVERLVEGQAELVPFDPPGSRVLDLEAER